MILIVCARTTLRSTPLCNATREAVSPKTGGFIDTPNQRMAITHVPPIASRRISRAFHVNPQPSPAFAAPLLLGEVAEVREGFPPPIGDAVINDKPGLLLIVEKQPQGNTLDVTRERRSRAQ